VDLLVVETQFDLNEAKTAIRAIRSISDIALICSFSYDRGKRTMMGVKPEQVIETLADSGIQAIGVNCGKSLETNLEVLIALKSLTDFPIWFKPNAGAPVADDKGGVHYTISADEMGAQAIRWVNHGAKFVGGCCGTSPEHLGAISRFVKSN
jgi:5-methyltetrahydrofolate--homocysteine methyltransferase